MADMNKVREFHEKNGFDIDIPLRPNHPHKSRHHASAALHHAASIVRQLAVPLERGTPHPLCDDQDYDPRCMRAQLVLEEVSELLESMARHDEEMTLDALADVLYVTYGTAVAFGLPIDEAFDEVARSNMTKQKQGDEVRLRRKGNGYTPPDMRKVLDNARS